MVRVVIGEARREKQAARSELRQHLLKTMLRLDPFEAGAFVKGVRAVARDARSDANYVTCVFDRPPLGGTDQRGTNAATSLPFRDHEPEDLRRLV